MLDTGQGELGERLGYVHYQWSWAEQNSTCKHLNSWTLQQSQDGEGSVRQNAEEAGGGEDAVLLLPRGAEYKYVDYARQTGAKKSKLPSLPPPMQYFKTIVCKHPQTLVNY